MFVDKKPTTKQTIKYILYITYIKW